MTPLDHSVESDVNLYHDSMLDLCLGVTAATRERWGAVWMIDAKAARVRSQTTTG
jgi:hypothetical protein